MHAIQAEYLRRLGAVAERREVSGAFAVRTGIASNTENGVVSTAADVNLEAIAELLTWLEDVPASWIALDPALGPSLVTAGCTPENESWNMQAEIGNVAPPSHEVRAVQSATDLNEWLAIARDCGWFDDVDPARRLHEALKYEGLYLTEDGAASAFFAPPTALLNTVAVRPHMRRRGIARSLALARLRDARTQGCTTAILAPSPDGTKLYASLGFRLQPDATGHWFYLPNRSST
jgi:GNAT superfamily N-acetyltransferase